jgi:type IV secretory pathway VirB10-like protein
MNWISDHFQIVILVLFAFGSWLKHHLESKAEEKARAERQREQAEDEFEEEPPFDDWKPEFQTPAPPVVPPPPPVLSAPPPPPPVPRQAHSRKDESDTVLRRQLDLQERLRVIKESKAQTSGGAAATRLRVAASQTGSQAPQLDERSGLHQSLRNRKNLRRGIVIREILGPPLALREPR